MNIDQAVWNGFWKLWSIFGASIHFGELVSIDDKFVAILWLGNHRFKLISNTLFWCSGGIRIQHSSAVMAKRKAGILRFHILWCKNNPLKCLYSMFPGSTENVPAKRGRSQLHQQATPGGDQHVSLWISKWWGWPTKCLDSTAFGSP